MDTRLVIKNLHFGYKGCPKLFKGIELNIQAGELVCLIGPNGAGKTTLIDLSLGNYKPHSGSIKIQGAEISSLKYVERAQKVACLPQRYQVAGSSTVFDVIMSGRRPYRTFSGFTAQDEAIALSAAKRLAVDSWLDRKCSELSGGEYQRVFLARVIAQETPLVLCDEPASSLDPKYLWGTFRLLRNLAHDEDIAILVSVHDLSIAATICDRIVLVADGQILYNGPPSDLKDSILSLAYGTEVRSVKTDDGCFFSYPEQFST